MALDFEFQFLPYGIFNWIAFILLVSSLVFLFLGGLGQKKDLKKLSKLLVFLGIVLLIWEIINLFIPIVIGDSPTSSETTTGFIYEFLLFIIIPTLLHISLGIVFILFGLKNISPTGQIISLAGLFYFIAIFESLIIGTISTYFGWYDPTFIDSLESILKLMEWIMYISYLIAALFVIIYSAKLKSKFLLIYGLLTLVVGTLELLNFLEVI